MCCRGCEKSAGAGLQQQRHSEGARSGCPACPASSPGGRSIIEGCPSICGCALLHLRHQCLLLGCRRSGELVQGGGCESAP